MEGCGAQPPRVDYLTVGVIAHATNHVLPFLAKDNVVVDDVCCDMSSNCKGIWNLVVRNDVLPGILYPDVRC